MSRLTAALAALGTLTGIFLGIQPASAVPALPSGSVTMYDAAAGNASLIPSGAAAVAGGPNWTQADWALFPSATRIQIAQTAGDCAKPVIDFERKFLFTASGLRDWVLCHQALGTGPGTVYAWHGNLGIVASALAGLSYYLWVADATGTDHVWPGANVVATQWSNYGNGPVANVDSSDVTDLAALSGTGQPSVTAHRVRHRTPRRMIAYRWAVSQRGCWYAWGGTGPCSAGYDCSGLAMRAWEAAGVDLPRTTFDMLGDGRQLRWIPPSQARKGDLAFFGAGHVEIVAYRDRWTIGAPEPGRQVGFHRSNPWWHPTAYYQVV